MSTRPERPQGRGQEIQQRLGAIRARIEELQVRRADDDTAPVSVGERLASAQRHAAASRAAAASALAAVVRAFRRSAESHVDAARQHERSAAAGFGDSAEHRQRAASHRAAAEADTREADRAQLYLRDEEAEDAHEPGPGPLLKRRQTVSDRAEELARLRQERARLRRRMAEIASLTAKTGEQVAETFEQIAEHRSPPDADRLRAEASVIREYAAKERSRAVNDGRGDDDGQAERAMARAPAKAGTNAPGSRTPTLANLAVSSDAGESR